VFWYNLVDCGCTYFCIIWLVGDSTSFGIIWLIGDCTCFGIIWLLWTVRVFV
jgi:hypothetical protein